jgi:hypothetical protein
MLLWLPNAHHHQPLFELWFADLPLPAPTVLPRLRIPQLFFGNVPAQNPPVIENFLGVHACAPLIFTFPCFRFCVGPARPQPPLRTPSSDPPCRHCRCRAAAPTKVCRKIIRASRPHARGPARPAEELDWSGSVVVERWLLCPFAHRTGRRCLPRRTGALPRLSAVARSSGNSATTLRDLEITGLKPRAGSGRVPSSC